MSKIALVAGREYFTRVKKKSFLLTTILVPLVIGAFYALIIFISMNDSSEKQKIAVLDEAGLLTPGRDTGSSDIRLTYLTGTTEAEVVNTYRKQGYDAFLYIPATLGKATDSSTVRTSSTRLVLHSKSSFSLSELDDMEELVRTALRNRALRASGINPEEFDQMTERLTLINTVDEKQGGKRHFAGVALGVSFVCGFLIYMMMLIYGSQVMRGVTEEKTNRISEVVISSVRPFQLMMGKILGIGAVGLTQFTIWMILIGLLHLSLPLIFPDITQELAKASASGQTEMSMAADTLQGISSLPIGKIIVAFLFYFIGGYLTYASLFAAVGSVVSEDMQETQQLVMPIMMPIIVAFVMLTRTVENPDDPMAVFGSMFPLTSPIVMMGRVTYDVPLWQWAVSVVSLILCFLFFTWLTGKIYRVGILMYGKKPSWKEMLRWAFSKN